MRIKKSISFENNLILITVIVFELLWRMPYNIILEYILELTLAGLVIWNVKKLPSLLLYAIIIFRVLPVTLDGAMSYNVTVHYVIETWMLICIIAGSVAYNLYLNLGKLKVDPVVCLGCIFGLGMCLTRIWAKNTGTYTLEFYCAALLYACLGAYIKSDRDVVVGWKAFITFGIILNLHLIPMALSGKTIYDVNARINRNYLALYTLICFMMTVTYIFRFKEELSKIEVLFLLLNCLGDAYLLISYASRSSFLVLMFFLCTVTLYLSAHSWKSFISIVLAFCVCTLVIEKSGIFEFLLFRLQEKSMRSGSHRFEIHAGFFNEFLSEGLFQKIFGKGHLQFRILNYYAHNAYLEVLLDFGLVVFVIFMILHLFSLRSLFKSKYSILLCALVAFMVSQTAIHSNCDFFAVSFFMYLVSLSIYSKQKNSAQDEILNIV